MDVQQQIDQYFNSQPEQKRQDMYALHALMLKILPSGKLWFESGINPDGKVVSNPNVGYGAYTINYANGTSREFFQIGISANTTGISVYIMGLKDKAYLAENFGKDLGKAGVTGYCIKFKRLEDIDTAVLEKAVRYGIGVSGGL